MSPELTSCPSSERKIDHFEERLRGIEDLLRKLSASLDNRPSELPRHTHHTHRIFEPSDATAITPSAIGDGSSTAYDEDRDELDSTFEGTSSLTVQTALASEFLEDAVGRTSLRELSPEMKSALSSLQQIVGMQQQKPSSEWARFPNQKSMPRGGIKELPMPPLQVVLSILREMKGTAPTRLSLRS